ncbi:MAG: hypothetical protein FGM15_04190 [Chthoniobacterales bacterium]|nr:hypothetical protein [Chthoniobacterales bacterium]
MIKPAQLLQVFHWPSVHQIRLVLPAMIVISLAVHLAAVYFVRGPLPLRGDLLPPLPAEVTVWPSGKDSILLAARDPSWLQPGRYRDRILPVQRREVLRSALQPEMPPLVPAPAASLPEAWVPALPPVSEQPIPSPRARAVAPAPAQISARFEQDGPSITAEFLGRLRDAAPADPPGLPTELLVSVDSAGQARHAWVLRSCGVPALDFAAQRAVLRSRFGSSPRDYRGVLRIVWAPGETGP